MGSYCLVGKVSLWDNEKFWRWMLNSLDVLNASELHI